MAALGLSLQTVGMTMQTALVEILVVELENEYDINIKYMLSIEKVLLM
jgi:hypothetical protein